jgi:uncharacterized protein
MAEFSTYAEGIPCWVDVTSPDLDRSIDFYRGLFGWDAEQATQPEAGGYTLFSLNGKLVAAGSPPPPDQEGVPSHWTTYLASDDADATAEKIRSAGGTVMMDPFDVFDSGRMTIAQDPTGAVFGIWQAREHIGAQLANEPGTLNWNECQTNDPEKAAGFYQEVFGYEIDEAPMVEAGEVYRVLKVDGRGIGGIMRITPRMEGVTPNWATTFSVGDTDETMRRTDELGGAVLAGPMNIPDVGLYAVLRDPAGAVFGVLQPPPEQA